MLSRMGQGGRASRAHPGLSQPPRLGQPGERRAVSADRWAPRPRPRRPAHITVAQLAEPRTPLKVITPPRRLHSPSPHVAPAFPQLVTPRLRSPGHGHFGEPPRRGLHGTLLHGTRPARVPREGDERCLWHHRSSRSCGSWRPRSLSSLHPWLSTQPFPPRPPRHRPRRVARRGMAAAGGYGQRIGDLLRG